MAIVTGTLRAVEAGPTVDLLEIYAAEELEKMRRQAADGDEPREVEKTDSSERETTTDGSGAAREVEKKTDPDAGSREEL